MMCITLKSGEDVAWYVNDTTAYHLKEPEFIANVVSVFADGHELEHIENSFANVPFRRVKRVVSWYGDMAKFIVANL